MLIIRIVSLRIMPQSPASS